MSISYKCPQCAANLVFDADQQMMICSFCGAKITPEEINTAGVNLDSDAIEEENNKDRQIHEKSAKAKKSRKVLDRMVKREYEAFAEAESVQYICGSCGAAVITDKNTSATFCAFCGSPTIITERLVDARKPDYIIPFKYGREKAIQSFFKWCHSGYLTPIDFVKKENVDKLTGLYVPFWLFNCVAEVDLKANASKTITEVTSDYKAVTNKIYNITRSGKVSWKMIPFDGASHIDDEQMKIIAPYDYNEIKEFDMAYLAGFFADRYDVPSEEVDYALYRDIAVCVNKIVNNSVAEYSAVFRKKDNSVIYPPDVKYALLPVWFLNYKYQGEYYTFAMNGQTGKTAGHYPVSLVKLLVILLALLPMAAVLVRLLLGGLVLGGIF